MVPEFAGQIGFPPKTMNQVVADAGRLGEFATGPVAGTVGGPATSRVKNLRAKTSGQLAGRLSGLLGFESVCAGSAGNGEGASIVDKRSDAIKSFGVNPSRETA